jgi:triphosphoribosyl-dephospho-CoA synthase
MNDSTSTDRPQFSIGQCAALASIMEATAPKPGNVHRGADFEDASYPDFIVAATLVAPIIEQAVDRPLGRTILDAVQATRWAVETNTNLGTLLLVAPLAKVPRWVALETGIADVLAQLTPEDARDVYEAIALARPGGLGQVDEADVHGDPPRDLVAAMRLAAKRDLVAGQYAGNFHEVLRVVVPWLAGALGSCASLSDAIVHVHLQIMSEYPDSLIARRRGVEVAAQAAGMAARVLAAGRPRDDAYEDALADLDFWLRADGHYRNPGTTADMVTAGLFAALRDGIIKAPLRLAR